jgi:hypothetical protein
MSTLMTCRDAARRLNVPAEVVRRLARARLITVLEIPGSRPFVNPQEVEEALRRQTRPAVQTAGGIPLELE